MKILLIELTFAEKKISLIFSQVGVSIVNVDNALGSPRYLGSCNFVLLVTSFFTIFSFSIEYYVVLNDEITNI